MDDNEKAADLLSAGKSPLRHGASTSLGVDVRSNGTVVRADVTKKVADIYTKQAFTEQIQKRSMRAGAIIDLILDDMEEIVRRHLDERRSDPLLTDKDAKVKDGTVLKAAALLLGFHERTQPVFTQQRTEEEESPKDLATMTPAELRELAILEEEKTSGQ